MTGQFQREYLVRLPLPLAQLYCRAHNAPAARARHDYTFYLFEALIKLAACPHVKAYLREVEQGAPRVESLDRLLAQLALPSLGQWVAILRELSRHFGKRPDAASHPLGHVWEQLNSKRHDLPGLLSLFRRIKNGPDGETAGDQSCSLLQLIDALVLYRNSVFGHGAARFDSFYEKEMGPLLFPAASELLAEGVFDLLGPSGSRLVYLSELRSIDENCVAVELSELVGVQSERMAALELTSQDVEDLTPNCVAVVWPGRSVPLRIDPLLVFHGGELADEVLFLNRDRNGRQVEYLSYTTGQTERDKSMAPAMARLLSRITGREVREEELQQLEQQSLAETPSVDALFEQTTAPRQTLGDYEILAQIGRGGMGVVYLARQMSLGRLVALKTLPADLAGDEMTLARFRREMKTLSRCEHPHIVKVLNSGTFPDGQVFYAMELIPGADLEMVWRELSREQYQGEASKLGGTTWGKAVLTASKKQREQVARRASGMPTVTGDETESADGLKPVRLGDEAASDAGTAAALPYPPLPDLPNVESDPGGYARHVAMLIRDAALALQEVHDEKIIHRDIKPANLMLSPDGSRVVLMDFGLAKGEQLTTTAGRGGGFLGTLRYAAPEQLAAAKIKIGPQADIRALGATLWELLARQRLFGDAEDEHQLASSVLNRDVPRLRSVDSSIDRDLEAVVAKATERESELRYQTAQEFAADLDRWERGEPVTARRYTLVNRVTRKIRRHRKSVAAALLLLVAAAVAGLWYWDAYKRVHVEYYARAVSRHGEPHGIRRLTPDQVRHRYASLKMYRRGRYGHILEMQEINGSDQPRSAGWGAYLASTSSEEGSREEFCHRYVRDAHGRVKQEVAYDRSGRITHTFQHNDTFTGGVYLDNQGYPLVRSGSGAAYLQYEQSREGFYNSIRFRPVLSDDGYARLVQKYDERGNVVEDRRYSADGQPTFSKFGVWRFRGKYDEQNNLIERAFYGIDGAPVLHVDGMATIKMGYDESGKRIKQAYFGVKGEPVLHSDGHHRWNAKYNQQGKETEKAYFDTGGEPTLYKDGYARITTKRDPRGNAIEQSYWDVDGGPVFHKDGYARAVHAYDPFGNQTESRFFGLDNRPVTTSVGVSKFVGEYDHRGNITKVAYFGTDGLPTLSKYGAAYHEYNLDENGQPSEDQDGHARITKAYGAAGNQIAEAYFDADGKPAPLQGGSTRWAAQYDDQNKLRTKTYFGYDVKSWGYSQKRFRYNELGQYIEVSLFDAQGKPATDGDKVHRWIAGYNQQGNQTSRSFFDEAGNPARLKDGYSGWSKVYDEQGKVREVSYLGFDGSDGYFQKKLEYDIAGNNTLITYLDRAGSLANKTAGSAKIVGKYDERGNQVEMAYFDQNDAPVRADGGFFRWTAKYDAENRLKEKTNIGFEEAKVGYFQEQTTYDERGNVLQIQVFAEDGKPAANTDGQFRFTMKYDQQNNTIEFAAFGPDGEPARMGDGFSHWIATYHANRKVKNKVFFGFDGSKGYTRIRHLYDENENQLEEGYLDSQGNLALQQDGFARIVMKYDDRGNKVETTFFDEKGVPAAVGGSVASFTSDYDDRGNKIAESFFGADGKPAVHADGYARWSSTYDSTGYHSSRTYYGVNGERLEFEVVVTEVVPDSQGERIGAQVGDVLIRYNGDRVADVATFIDRRKREGDLDKANVLEIKREGETLQFEVHPGRLGLRLMDRVISGEE